MLKYSEVCLIAGTWLYVSGSAGFGVGLIIFSAAAAFCRFALEYQRVSQKEKEKEEMLKGFAELGEALGKRVGVVLGGKNFDGTVH